MGCCIGLHVDPKIHQAKSLVMGSVIWASTVDNRFTVTTVTSQYDAKASPQLAFTARRGEGDTATYMNGEIEDGNLTLSVNHGREWGAVGHFRDAGPSVGLKVPLTTSE
jgi:hypothetical protein